MSHDPLAILRDLGSPAELRSQAPTAASPLPNNSHLHLPPNFSAFTTVRQAMELADSQGCRIVGASNYYDYSVYGEFAALAREKNVLPLYGLEIICMIEDLRFAGIKINDPGNPGKMYICGKGITRFTDNMTPEARRLLGIIRSNDSSRISKMVDALSRLLTQRGLPTLLDSAAVIDKVARRHDCPRETVYLQERHVAQAFQEYIFANVPTSERIARLSTLLGAAPNMKSPEDFVGLQNDIRTHLMKAGKPGYVEESFVDFPSATRLIRELGGFVSYPILADGAKPICPFEDPVGKLVADLRSRNIHAAELIPGRNDPAVAGQYAHAMRAAGLIVTAGTEHNTLDLIPVTPTCLNNVPIPAELLQIFYEGACVIAAHQYLAAHGETGYVDAQGHLNPDYPTAETRIATLARLGDTVIRRYLERKAA